MALSSYTLKYNVHLFFAWKGDVAFGLEDIFHCFLFDLVCGFSGFLVSYVYCVFWTMKVGIVFLNIIYFHLILAMTRFNDSPF
jgi:hypothetical protein